MTAGSSERDYYISRLFAKELWSKQTKIIFVTHRQADPDALCAAYGLSQLVKKSRANEQQQQQEFQSTILVPQGASSLGNSVAKSLGISFVTETEVSQIEDSDEIIVVDAGDAHLLEPFLGQISESRARKILIDHHSANTGWKGFEETVIDSAATSTCELITLGFPEDLLDRSLAQVLLTGLLFDSQHLGIATTRTLEAALSLSKAGAEVSEAKKILRSRPDKSEIIARIKSAQRLQFEECKGRLILRSEVSSFQAAVARMLLEIGGDVGVAYGENSGEFRLSARSTQSFHKETGIDLSEEARKLCGLDSPSLSGGGHATAASISGSGDPKLLSRGFVEQIKARLLQN